MNLVDLLKNRDDDDTKAQVSGVVVALVTDNKDPQKMGRVKVKFPWRGDDVQSHWARVATFMAGKGRGSFFLPEVHDEVLVAFDRGNIDHPFVVGGLWNGKDKPPATNKDGKNNIRKFKSRSGHEIIFDDNAEEKKEKLEIKTNAGHKVVLDDASSKEKIEIKSKAGHKIVLNDAPGKEKIEIVDKSGSNKLVIDSVKKAVNIESGMKLSLKAKMIEITGETSLTLKSDAMVTVKGAMVKIN